MSTDRQTDSQLLMIRFLTGVWCLTCFVLVTAYSSVLVSFMTAPEIYKPIINSVNDLPTKRDIKVTVTRNLITDVIFRVYKNTFSILWQNHNNNIELLLERCWRWQAKRNLQVYWRRIESQFWTALHFDRQMPLTSLQRIQRLHSRKCIIHKYSHLAKIWSSTINSLKIWSWLWLANIGRKLVSAILQLRKKSSWWFRGRLYS